MSTDREPRPDEDLLELLLGGSEAARDLELAPEERLRLEDWRGFLEECRSELRTEEHEEAADLAGLERRVLAGTTREDVSWRGDLALWRGFLAQRLGASAVLRVVAASLLVHVAALPVLAYYTWKQPAPERGVQVDFSPRSEPPFRVDEPEPPSVVDAPDLEAQPREGGPVGQGAAELLRERLAAAPLAEGDPLVVALRCETLLDARALGVVEVEGLDEAIDRLELELRRLALRDERAVLRAVLASAYLRAVRLGLRPEEGPLAASARRWVGAARPLEGTSWRAAVRRAARELDGR
jgi:hypothetical protein